MTTRLVQRHPLSRRFPAAPSRPVVVHAQLDGGGRRVTLRGEQAGIARSVTDVVEMLRCAGVDLDAEEAAASPLIEWRGGGPQAWSA
ncbi:hypothetical protein [Streptomyces sp. NPDC049813]|uniref:hypothetical protein n=1 Tax=Streptomyces sp. NPDC049813 TaxID=3365597 RepID=UPI00378B3848